MQVLWSNEQESLILPEHLDQLVNRTVEYAAKRLNLPSDAEVSIAFVDDASIAELNATYRSRSGPTDVLSFAFAEGEDIDLPAGAPLMLGDIIISVERAQDQAEEYEHGLEREIVYLLVHGLLHLAGYDHDDENEGEMKTLNEEIVRGLGYTR